MSLPTLAMVFFLFFLVGVPPAAQETPKPDASPKTCSFSEVYRDEGWLIPGLKGATPNTRGRLQQIPGVFVTTLSPTDKGDLTITEPRCSRDHEGRLEMRDQPMRIKILWAFDFNGKPFAYRLQYGKEAIENGRRYSVGAARDIMFYDIDGSGKFTLYSDFGPTIAVPDWASGTLDRNHQK